MNQPKIYKCPILYINEISLNHSISLQSRPLAPKMPEKPLEIDSFCFENSNSIRNEGEFLIFHSEPNKSRDFSLNIRKNEPFNIRTYTPKNDTNIFVHPPLTSNKKSEFSHNEAIDLSKNPNLTIKNTNILNGNNLIFLKPMNIEHQQSINSRKKSVSNPGFLRFLILNDHSNFFLKLKMIFQNLFLSHLLANLVTICKILVQNKINSYCWISLCFCHDEIGIKIYSTLSDLFFYWALYCILCAKCIVVAKEFSKIYWLKGFIYIIIGAFILIYYIASPEDSLNTMNIYIFLVGFCLTIYGVYLYILKFSVWIWLKNMFKINSLIIIVFLNHLLLRYYMTSFLQYIKSHTDEFWGKNLMLLFVAIYFKTFAYAIKKLLFMYYEFIKSQNKISSRTLIGLCRYIICFIVCFNVSGLLKMNPNDIGGWVLLLFYTMFVFSAYINTDLKEIWWDGCLKKCSISVKIKNLLEKTYTDLGKSIKDFGKKITEKISMDASIEKRIREKNKAIVQQRNERKINEESIEEVSKNVKEKPVELIQTKSKFSPKEKNKNNEDPIKKKGAEQQNLDSRTLEYIKFERMFAGALLDIIFVCSSRVIIWFVFKRWIIWFYTLDFYKNCQFEMSDSFIITNIGFSAVISVNFAVTLLVLAYMFKKKKIFFDYKFRKHQFYNTYYLVLMHSFFEGMIQSIYAIT